jgi:alginate O-acetyltransferase complex protein AlgI
MLFHTLPFLVFMLIVLPVFHLLRKTSFWIPWLLAASYFFYGVWNPYYLILIVYSTALDYLLVALMDHSPPQDAPRSERKRDAALNAALYVFCGLGAILLLGAVLGPATLRPTLIAFTFLVFMMALGAMLASRKIWLVVSLVNNLALLLFFKYARFVVENINALLGSKGVHIADPSVLMPYGSAYLLPVGISFFTFQSMSYTIDFYLGKAPRERNILRFATFVCFFPQLMAGPIERARHMLPQFQKAPEFKLQTFLDGLSLFLVGLFKKLAMANYLSLYVDRVYDNPANANASTLIAATIAFAWQIFFDFSGYTDMARGCAKMLGFELMLNFNNPYLSTGLGEFWTRWHISLSSWFRDYVYIPLGGNRKSKLLTYRNLFITFLVSGVWHGANWNFFIWGALHAVGVIVTRELERSEVYRTRVPKLLKQTLVFAYVCFAWIFFRAATTQDAMTVISRIVHGISGSPQVPGLMIAMIAAVWGYQLAYESRYRKVLASGGVRIAIAVAMILYLCLCSSGGGAFIYFQF